jgi:hypothetical protein
MTEYVYVIPASGGRVRMPDRNSRVMEPKGAWVPRIDYYERLLIGGDVVLATPPDEPAPDEPAADAAAVVDEPPAPDKPSRRSR